MSSIGAMRLLFQAGSRTIAGSLGGKFLNCTIRPPQGGALPPAGDYEILPPMNDPIYGRVAVMASVGQSGPVRVELAMQKCLVSASFFLKPEATPTAIGQKIFLKPDARSTSISQKLFEKPMAARRMGHPASSAGGQAFVLSDRPVLGRNCVVVSSGFADLMDGLQKAVGARVTVA